MFNPKVQKPDCDGTLVSCEECVASVFRIYRFEGGGKHILVPVETRTNAACPIVYLHVEQGIPVAELAFPDKALDSQYKQLRKLVYYSEEVKKEEISVDQLLKDDLDCLCGLLPATLFSKLDAGMIERITQKAKDDEDFKQELAHAYPEAYKMREKIYSERGLNVWGDGIEFIDYLKTPMICMYCTEEAIKQLKK